MEVKSSPIMPRGWHHKDNHPVMGIVTIPSNGQAKDLNDLYKEVSLFRLHSGMPGSSLDEVKIAVRNYICSEWPHQCTPGDNSAQLESTGKPTKPRLLDRVAYWAGTVFNSQKATLVTHEESMRRAEICKACPKNRKWETCSTCGSLISETKRLLLLLRKGMDVNTGGLLGCDSCGHDNATAVWLNQEVLTRGQDAPERCWVGK